MDANELTQQLSNPIGATICLRGKDGVLHDLGVTVAGVEFMRSAVEVLPPLAPFDGCRHFVPSHIVTGQLYFTSESMD